MENQLKDEQILRQGEEIESQRRKIESLEAELQKFLSTDSGEINPALKSGGEAGLLEKIATLQSRLDKCTNKDFVIIRTKAISNMLAMAAAAPFMPKYVKKEGGSMSFHSNYFLWSGLQTVLLSDSLNEYWSNKSFKGALSIVNYITNKLAIHDVGNLKTEQYDEAARDLGYYCYYADPEDHEAFILLKEMVEKIKADGLMSYLPIDDLLVSIMFIVQCQQIDLCCQEEPEETEVKQDHE